MKKLLAAVMVLVVPIFISTGAWALTVVDQEGVAGAYYGGTYTDKTLGPDPTYAHDVNPAGDNDWSVTGLTAKQIGSSIQVVLSGSYFGTQWADPGVNGQGLGGKPGDLYISSTGWRTSSGSAADHWASDTFIADKLNPKHEGWNYVVSYGQSLVSHSGDIWTYKATLYQLTNSYLTTSNADGSHDPFNSFRSDQAWRGGYGDLVTTTDAYAILDMAGTEANGNTPTLTFTFFNALGWDPDQLGYHWTMSCGNDVAEGGGTPVPEPGSLLLLGLALAGLGVYRWKAAREYCINPPRR